MDTKRLILKAHTIDNLEKLTKWMNDPELLFYDDNEPEPYEQKSEEEMRGILERLIASHPDADRGIIQWAIHKKADHQLIGYCMIAFIDHYNQSCKVGLTVGEKSEWHKGYATEVVEKLTDYAFNQLNLNRVGAEIYAHNAGSIRVFEKAGYQREGVIRQSVLKKGQFVDEYIFGILKEDWLKNGSCVIK